MSTSTNTDIMTTDAAESSSFAERRYRPYFAPDEVAYLIQQHAGKLPPARVEAIRQQACGLIDKIGGRLGFPRRTTATAQLLYHRFHLFFPVKDFAVQDVAIAVLLVSCKLEDTLKKLREIQIAAYQVKSAQDGVHALTEPDQHALEAERPQLIGIERLILETISFNFNLRSNAAYPTRHSTSSASQNQDVFAYVIKIGRALGGSKDFVKRAFRMAVDAHRTVLPLSYPPHTIAVACLYLTTILTSDESSEGAPIFQEGWEGAVQCDILDIEDVCHGILDLLLSLGSAGPSSAKTSPSETILPFQSPREPGLQSASSVEQSALLNADLIQIKIQLRSQAAKRARPDDTADAVEQPSRRQRTISRQTDASASEMTAGLPETIAADGQRDLLGRDDVTVRFMWDPPDVAEGVIV